MSTKLAHYSFLPWLKQGLGSKITEKDLLGQTPSGNKAKERAELKVELKLEDKSIDDGSLNETTITKNIKIYGPGDIIGISRDAIVQAYPKNNLNSFESNGLPYVEFYEEDFLWRYTPASVAETGSNVHRLTPWLALIVLKEDEFTPHPQADGPSYISINSDNINDVFHKETTHWAWAHVQMATEMEATTNSGKISEVESELAADPDSGLSRIVCPRKLVKETAYQAFLIPAFETGRLAGLGEDITGVYAQEMSWEKGNMPKSSVRPTDFPYYYTWKFKTGLYGDFESLVSILKPFVSSDELGKRPMDIQKPGFGLDGKANSKTLGLEGALKPPGFKSQKWPNGNGDKQFRNLLRNILNLSIDSHENTLNQNDIEFNPFYSTPVQDDPIITPHIYGRWHALATRLQDGANYDWVDDLNLDPRNRSVAGLGTNVVQKNQEDLMKRAWQQVGKVNEANKKIREAELAKMVSNAIYNKTIKYADTDKTIALTSPMHNYVLGSAKTINQEITESRIPNAVKSAAFKKIIRPGKKINKIINQHVTQNTPLIHQQVVTNFNKQEGEQNATMAAKKKEAPDMAIPSSDVQAAIQYSVDEFTGNAKSMAQQEVFKILNDEDFTNLTSRKTSLINEINPALSSETRLHVENLINNIESSKVENNNKIAVIKTDAFKIVFGDGITGKFYNSIIIKRSLEEDEEEEKITSATSIDDIKKYKNNFLSFTDVISNLNPITSLPSVDALGNYSMSLTDKLNPKINITNRIISRIKIWSKAQNKFVKIKKLKPVMAYPEFSDSMFYHLKKISQDYIIPNIDKVPENSITLLETNQPFIESFMAGLNHEFARELLWREYPTDQRGTYFRRFWDIKDNVMESNEEMKLDIETMDKWKKELGEHSPRKDKYGKIKSYLVLLIKGELFLRYPNTMVYAQEAQFDNGDTEAARVLPKPIDSGNIKYPVFQAELDPDIYMFGFDLDKDVAKGNRDSNPAKPGWFFVLKERPGQLRFGLDDYTPVNPDDPDTPAGNPETWNDMSWEHLITNKSELNNYQIDFSKTINVTNPPAGEPNPVWGKNAADMASILLQNPVLFARHAQEMLPD